MVVTLQSDRVETEPELAVKPKPKKEGSVFPAKRRLVKTMVFNSVLHLFVSVCSSAGRGAAKPKTQNGKKFKQIVPTMSNASPVTTNKSGEFVLPPELWGEIYKRLVLSDRIRFSSVLPLISISISQKPPPPPVPESWLLLGHTVSCYLRKNRFHCLSDKRVYSFGNIIPRDCRVLGSSNGWLLTILASSIELNLLNPILNAQIRIAKLSSLSYIKKLLVVETRAASGDSTVIVRNNVDRVIVYRNTEYYDQAFEAPPSADIAFYKGKIYGLVITQRRFEIHVSGLEALFEQLYVVRGIAPTWCNGMSYSYYYYYLVESRGDLLFVTRQFKNLRGGFQVFKLVLANGFADAVKLHSLGDQALFCGSHGCISLPVGEFSLFLENHLYFIPDPGFKCSCEVCGVSLKDGSIKQISSNLPLQPSATSNFFWFVPTTKDIAV
ncbi:hypothetical protein M0R45_011418 [Rubus argutus]|uniref:KIB1-4 beta-propeller domain-containing protein n=1 Tax=Rubus argutus TaxID=59490 RepID=A0AAW1YDZ3_RUBAR